MRDDSSVHAYWFQDESLQLFMATKTTTFFRKLIEKIGSGRIGVLPKEIGTYSIRSGFAMALVLGGTPVFEIMIIGRWSLDAFI